jgi:hypothetical protein
LIWRFVTSISFAETVVQGSVAQEDTQQEAPRGTKGCDHYTNGDAMKRIFKRYPIVAGHNVQYKYTRYGGYACGRRYARSTLPPDQRFDPLQGMKREVRNVAAKPGVAQCVCQPCSWRCYAPAPPKVTVLHRSAKQVGGECVTVVLS